MPTFAQRHSQKLIDLISSEIASSKGKITFARYMELALYAPGLGYYSAGAKKIGPEGDFITAPEISPLFSRCMANPCQIVLQHLKQADILELGAGTGIMATDILKTLETLHTLPTHYFILETSADLKERQFTTFKKDIPHLLPRIEWLDTLPSSFTGIILANEVADALPVHRFRVDGEKIQEFYVAREDNKFVEVLDSPSTPALVSAIKKALPQPVFDYESEMNLLLPAWIKSLSDTLSQGLILLIDYGFSRHEYYNPTRHRGTWMCHSQHRAHSDPFFLPGLQDITAHVDFTTIAESAFDVGLLISGYTTQSAFLLGNHLLELAHSSKHDIQQQLKINQQIKKLTLESDMGELFKVIGLTRDFNMLLPGFHHHDLRYRL